MLSGWHPAGVAAIGGAVTAGVTARWCFRWCLRVTRATAVLGAVVAVANVGVGVGDVPGVAPPGLLQPMRALPMIVSTARPATIREIARNRRLARHVIRMVGRRPCAASGLHRS